MIKHKAPFNVTEFPHKFSVDSRTLTPTMLQFSSVILNRYLIRFYTKIYNAINRHKDNFHLKKMKRLNEMSTRRKK